MIIILLLIPLVMIIYGWNWRKKPPKYPANPDMRGWTLFIDYRTEWSTKSPDTWYYSHICYGRMLFPLGILALVITILGVVFFPTGWMAKVLLVLDLAFIMLPYYPIEKNMRRLFDRKGRRLEDVF